MLRITGNGKGKIYLLCTEGVAEFDMSTEKFTTLIQGGNIGCVYYSNYTNALYIGMGSEIYRYNEKTGNFDLNAQLAGNSPEISCLYRQDDKVWVGTFNDGLYMYKLTSPESARQILKRGNISDIYEDSDGELWVGSWEEGLYRIRPDGSVSNYRNEARNEPQPVVQLCPSLLRGQYRAYMDRDLHRTEQLRQTNRPVSAVHG